MQMFFFEVQTLSQPFGIVLPALLIALIWSSYSQSDRFIRIVMFLCAAASLKYGATAWFCNYKHISLVIMLYSVLGLFFSFSGYFSDKILRRSFVIWMIGLAVGVVWSGAVYFTSFHPEHFINRPFRLYFSGYTAWAIFAVVSLVLMSKNRFSKKSFAIFIMTMWTMVISLEGLGNMGIARLSEGLYWGSGTDAEDYYGRTRLYNAVEKNDVEEIKRLLDAGADVNNSDTIVIGGPRSPFEASVLYSDFDTFLLLANKGGKINQKNKDGNFPLHLAAHPITKDIRIMKYLIEHGADINVRDKYDNQPIHAAVAIGFDGKKKQLGITNIETIGLLLDKGADIESLSKDKTPLILAVSNGNLNAVKFLVEKGADINAKDKSGRNALETAQFEIVSRQKFGLVNGGVFQKIIDYLTPIYAEKK